MEFMKTKKDSNQKKAKRKNLIGRIAAMNYIEPHLVTDKHVGAYYGSGQKGFGKSKAAIKI